MATQDKLILYASVFLYKQSMRAEFMDYQPSIQNFESKIKKEFYSIKASSQIPNGSSQIFNAFIQMSDAD